MEAAQTITLGNRIGIRWRWLLVALPTLFVAGVVAFATIQPVKVLPRIRPAPAFTVFDQAGQRVTNEDVRGQIVLYTFSAARCGPACEPGDAIMAAVQAEASRLSAGGLNLLLVTMLFDADRGAPAAAQAFAQAHAADPVRWRVVSGDPAGLKQTIGGGFEVYYAAKPDGGYNYEPALVLVDGLGIIRGEYRAQAQNLDAATIVRQIEVLQSEVRNSAGANRLAYEAAHFFLCYAH
jgi:protein SCO1/2